MRWVKLGTHVTDHERFLAAGAEGRDLYVWGLTYAGKHETDGEIPMVAVLASPWGAGGSANIKVATKLVAVGLWARTDTGFLSLKWKAQGNETKASLSEKREAALARKAKASSQKVRANEQRTDAEGFKSKSKSLSGSVSGSQIASSTDPAPEWFTGACEAAVMATGQPVDDRPARWLEYAASRERKGWSMNHGDAVGWLTTVMRSERSKTRAGPAARGAEITKQPFDPNAPWLKLPEVG